MYAMFKGEVVNLKPDKLINRGHYVEETF